MRERKGEERTTRLDYSWRGAGTNKRRVWWLVSVMKLDHKGGLTQPLTHTHTHFGMSVGSMTFDTHLLVHAAVFKSCM